MGNLCNSIDDESDGDHCIKTENKPVAEPVTEPVTETKYVFDNTKLYDVDLDEQNT